MIIKRIQRAKALLLRSAPEIEPFSEVSKVIVPTTSKFENPWEYELNRLYNQEEVLKEYGVTTESKTQTFLSQSIDKKIVLVSCLTQIGHHTEFNFKAFEKGVLSATDSDESLLIFIRIFFRKQCVYSSYEDFDNLLGFLYSCNRKITLAYSENGHYSNNLSGWPSYFEEDAKG